MRRSTAVILAIAALCAAAAGPDAWAKMLWRAGVPSLAIPLITDDAARGAALYHAGRYSEADATFAAVGRSATYDRGLSLAATGRFRLSVAYFDAVLFADRYDVDAHHNRAVVEALVEPVIGEAMGHGRIRTILAEHGFDAEEFDPGSASAPIKRTNWQTDRDRHKRSVIHDRKVAANEAWIDSLSDAPGEYLKARLDAELVRRRALGSAAPEEPSRW